MNVMAASLAARCTGIQINSILKTLKKFQGVEHRLEYVTSLDGIDIINDSKSTTVESLVVALSSFTNPIILIAGGKDKGGDFSRLNVILTKKTKMIILIGEAKNKIADSWRNAGTPIFLENTLKSAVEKALVSAVNGDLILLSPACASFDMFQNFEDRGRQFKQLVLKKINSMVKNEKTRK
jgi:UDP-N-acetylmuramoylalanine--D-glutamate ligase